MKFTVIVTTDEEDGGFVAECPSIPGCVSGGATIEEALRNIKDAVGGCVEVLIAQHQPLPHETQLIVATIDANVAAPGSGIRRRDMMSRLSNEGGKP